MSYLVKPEDVPAGFAYTHCLRIAEGSMEDITADIASILNAAIEAGIVSPPVYCVRQDGEILKNESGDVRIFVGKPWTHDTEHWKGQTE